MLISAKLKCYVFISARVSEISEGFTRRGTGKGLRYKVNHGEPSRTCVNIYRILKYWSYRRITS